MVQRKLFLGARLKRLRRERGLQQGAMAAELGISPSYLNHLERNQRPVTAGILLKLADAYDIDIRAFASEGGEHGGADQLAEVFTDGMFQDLGVSRQEILETADNAPALAEAVTRLYTAFRELQRHPVGADTEGDERSYITPETWVRDFIQSSRNHFPDLEDGAETLGGALGDPLSVAEPLRRRLKEAYGVDVRVASPEEMEGASQVYDPQRRLLLLSSLLRPENKTFGIAYQLSLLELHPIIARLIEAARPPDAGTRHLLHVSLANYAAGAIMMPYGKFLTAAERYRYSIDRLCAEFGANVEQVAHRLTTMNRQGARGVPFFMLRIDPAGNVSKRYAGEKFPFSRFGGTCPRWNLHAAFQAAGQVVTQLIETPDGHRYFTVARTIERPIKTELSGGLLAIGLGCDIEHAHRLHCAEGIDLERAPVTPVGPSCGICPRMDCAYRATPPAGRTLAVHEFRKTVSPFPFVGA
ncbi:short-chain fatty acyl-CoA regulator family protein [Sphingomonas sp. KRR8]|uniref:helix-turn-helix domain-containing protein n=1 Tax=Sphingomonas sp. KRR8 TaxID=2942996 RepID=UPI0020219DE7|nr:helix-turn-helix transcriptional regulator [Sphingomonas sp. KRR8]URD60226.1 short-chain fatty acyl-CoA regulator family protein [Sphingomonas sp. KRR8]